MLAVQPHPEQPNSSSVTFYRISGRRAVDVDRAGDGVDLAEVEGAQIVERRSGMKLAAGTVDGADATVSPGATRITGYWRRSADMIVC